MYDLIIYGATGFTGSLAVKYMAKQYGNSISWAIAGRNESKLNAVAADVGQNFPDVILANSNDKTSLVDMVKQTRVIATSAGPFSRYGTSLVEACAENGVDYCDITGEMNWVREMIAKYDDKAKASGARIVSLCGHDSIPWDLSVLMLAKKLKEDHNTNLATVEFYDGIRGSVSGGTLETAMGIMFGQEKGQKASSVVQSLGYDPLLKLKDGSKSTSGLKANNVSFFEGSKDKSVPHRTLFFMAGVNANAVKRSNALNGYGNMVKYKEGQAFKGYVQAFLYLSALTVFGLAMCVPPIRYLLRKYALYKPGEGPSEETMKKGFLSITGIATGENGVTVKSNMFFKGDPGYKETARMLVESALSFSLGGGVQCEGGVYTPASCQKDVLLKRLTNTGTKFEYIE